MRSAIRCELQCQGILTEGGRLRTVDLLVKLASFCIKVNNIFNVKRIDLY